MKKSELRKIIRESIKELLNEIEFLTQQEMDDACAHHGYGSGVSHDCTPDANNNVPPTYTCEILCSSGAKVTTNSGDHLDRDRFKTTQVGGGRINKSPINPLNKKSMR